MCWRKNQTGIRRSALNETWFVFFCLLMACSSASVETTPTAIPIPTLRPPQATPMPQLRGHLWVDRALGDVWRNELPTGRVSRVSIPTNIFPAQPNLSSDGKQLALLGAIKTDDGVPSQRFGIYINNNLVLPATNKFSYEDVIWSADGKQIFFTRVGAESAQPKPTDSFLAIQVADVSSLLTAGTLITNAFQPAPSPNGEWLAYLSLDTSNPLSLTRSIRLRNLKTNEDRIVIAPNQFFDVYGPRWLNNSQLIFSAAESPQATPRTNEHASERATIRMLDALLGVRVAVAHSWAGNVWRVNIDEISATSLIQLNKDKLQAPIAAPAPDGKHIAVLAYDGVFVMTADGANWTQISNDGGNGGLAWTW
jgi:hypothetical protein